MVISYTELTLYFKCSNSENLPHPDNKNNYTWRFPFGVREE